MTLLGHGWVIDALRHALAQRRAAHAYLISGPAHVGKSTTALAMAMVLLCAEGTGCGACRHCRLAARRAHPDLRILEPPAERKTIPIKDVHELIHGIALRPLEAPCKVYLIDGAEQLSVDGADALLKTLEEPPPNVALLVTAEDPAQLLPTVVSRCQRITLRPVPLQEIQQYLVHQHSLDPSAADAIARGSRGRPGCAILAASTPELLDVRQRWAGDLLHLLASGRLARIQYADGLADQWGRHPEIVRETLEEWAEVWRQAARASVGLEGAAGAPIPSQVPAAATRDTLARTFDVLDALRANANARLALETFLLSLPKLANLDTSPEEPGGRTPASEKGGERMGLTSGED